MDQDILYRIMEVFSQENKKLKDRILELEKQVARYKKQEDGKTLDDVFKTLPDAIVAPTGQMNPAPVSPVSESLSERQEYQRKYQAEYRAKKKQEKLNQSSK